MQNINDIRFSYTLSAKQEQELLVRLGLDARSHNIQHVIRAFELGASMQPAQQTEKVCYLCKKQQL